MDLFLSPHNDDETLFGFFTLMRARPLVAVVFDGHVQAARGERVTAAERRQETNAVLEIAGLTPALFLGYSDAKPVPETFRDALRNLLERVQPETVYAPAVETGGHDQHNLVGQAALDVFPRVVSYMTYTRTGGKSRGVPVTAQPDWIARKLRALACYRSQIAIANCREHFLRDQHEYYLD